MGRENFSERAALSPSNEAQLCSTYEHNKQQDIGQELVVSLLICENIH